MKARERIFLVTIPVATLLFLLLMSITLSIERESMMTHAKIYAEEKVMIFEKMLEIELQNVERLCADWAFWDDTYEFIKTREERYIVSNLGESTFKNAKINLMIFVDEIGNVVYSNFYDENWDKIEVPTIFLSSEMQNKTGFIKFGENLVLISSKPILRSNATGDARGYLVMGRIVDKNWLREVEKVLNAEIFYGRGAEIYADVVITNSRIKDLFGGEIVFVIKAINPYYSDHIRNLIFFLIHFSLLSLVFYFLAIFLIDKGVISKILKLEKFVISAKPGDKIDLEGSDEIKRLADGINSMLSRIAKSEKEIRFLLGILRHDLLNIFTSITAYMEFLKHEKRQDYLEKVEKQVERGINLIKAIKQLEDGKTRKIRIGEVVEKLRGTFAIDIELVGDAEILADDGIYVIFGNLIENAIKHGKASKVSIEVKKNGGILIKLRDNGTGFSEIAKERAFKEIYTEGGTGVGLLIVKRLVEKYRGWIEIMDSNTIAMRFPSPVS
ncbi:MAG: CHASE4 domain-containing protein [Archaeoglobaceae archaeon]